MKGLLTLLAITAAALVSAIPASADPPTVRQFTDTFVDVNPCTGLLHTVTIEVTAYEISASQGHATHVITTSSGFVGRGEEVSIFHGGTFLANDILFNAQTGQRVHAQLIVVSNPATGDLQVLRQTLTCIPAG